MNTALTFDDLDSDLDAHTASNSEVTFLDAQLQAAKTVTCPRCRGSGRYGMYGKCYKCDGNRFVKADKPLMMDKDSIARRETYKERAQAKRVEDTAIKLEYWNTHQDIITKINQMVARGNPFGISLKAYLTRVGSLTEAQEASVRKMITQDAERAIQRQQAAPNVSGEGFTKMLEAFNKASATGLRHPTLRCGELVFTLAAPTSKNAGFIYAKIGGNYQGKISPTGTYFKSFGTLDAVTAKVSEIARDPFAAAVNHGRLTGCCAICARQLVDPESVSRGIGPICAKRFGWL